MKKQALQLLLALGLVAFCVGKAAYKLQEIRRDCAGLRADVETLKLKDRGIEIVLAAHETDLVKVGIGPTSLERISQEEGVSYPTPPRVLPAPPHRRR